MGVIGENTFAGDPLDRGGWPHPTRSRVPGWTGSRRGGEIATGWRRRRQIPRAGPSWRGRTAVLVDGDALALVPLDGLGEPLLLGVQDGRALFAVDGEGRSDLVGVRAIAPSLAQDEGGLLAYAAALLNWHRRHRFCSVCGTASQVREAGLLRVCPACGAEHHPRTDPVVIMLVVDGERDRVLLGRQAVLAGGALLRAGGVRRAGRVAGGRGRARGLGGVGGRSGGRALCLLAAVAVPELADAGVRGLVCRAERWSRRTASSRTRAGSRALSWLKRPPSAVRSAAAAAGDRAAADRRLARSGAVIDAAAVRSWCLARPGVTEERPFGPRTTVFKVEGKVFLLSALERDAPRGLPEVRAAARRAAAPRLPVDGPRRATTSTSATGTPCSATARCRTR